MSDKLPVTGSDKAMSVRHLKESIAVNRAHEADHRKQKAKQIKQLAKVVKKGGKTNT